MSEKRTNLELRGCITTVAPFANSPADCKVKSGADKDLQKLPRISGKPFIAASAIRGMLRRAAALEAVGRFPRGRVEYVDWLLFSVGGVKGSGDEKCDPDIRHQYIEGNPLVALFGAGHAAKAKEKIGGMIGSKLHIAHAIVDDETVILKKGDGVIGGARAHENTSAVLREVVEDMDSVREFTRVNHDRAALEKDIERLNRKLHPSGRNAKKEDVAPDERRKMEKEEKEKTSALKAVEEEMRERFGTDNPLGMPLIGYEAIPAGQRIPHRMTLAAVSPAQLGLFFAALERFALEPIIGAHRAHGCGRVRCEYDVYEHQRDDRGARLRCLGRLMFGEPELPKEFPEKAPSEIPVMEVIGGELEKLRSESLAAWGETDPENLRPYSHGGTKPGAKK